MSKDRASPTKDRNRIDAFWDYIDGYMMSFDLYPESDFRHASKKDIHALVDDYWQLDADVATSIDSFCSKKRGQIDGEQNDGAKARHVEKAKRTAQ
jgi:hypothetical protein